MDPSIRRRVPPPPPKISAGPVYPSSSNAYHSAAQQRPLFPSGASARVTSSAGYREWDEEDQSSSRKPPAYYTGGDAGMVKAPSRVSFNLSEDIFEDRSRAGREEVEDFRKIWQDEFKETIRESLDQHDTNRGGSRASIRSAPSRGKEEEYEYARRYDRYDSPEAVRPGRYPPSSPPLERPIRTSVPRKQTFDEDREGVYVPAWKKSSGGEREERYESGADRYPNEPSRRHLSSADSFDERFFVGSPEVRSLRGRDIAEENYQSNRDYEPKTDRFEAQSFSESDFSDERFLQRRRLLEDNVMPARRSADVALGLDPALRVFKPATNLEPPGSDQPSRWAPSRFEAETIASKKNETAEVQRSQPKVRGAVDERYAVIPAKRPEYPPPISANRQEHDRRQVYEIEKPAEDIVVPLKRAKPQPNRSIPMEDGMVQVLKEINGKVTQGVFQRKVTHIEAEKAMGFAGRDMFFHMKKVKGPLVPVLGDTVSVIAERVEMLPFDWKALSIEVVSPSKQSDPELTIPLNIPVNPSPPLGQRKPPPPPILSKPKTAKRAKSPDSPVVLFDGLNIIPLPQQIKARKMEEAASKRRKVRSPSPKQKKRKSPSASPPAAKKRSPSLSPPKAFRRCSSGSISPVVRRRLPRSITPPRRKSRSITPPSHRRRPRSRSITPPSQRRRSRSRSITPPRKRLQRSITPPLRRRSWSRSVTPPPRSRLSRSRSNTPPSRSRLPRSISISPPLRGRLPRSRSRSRSISPRLRRRRSRSRSFSPPRRNLRSRSRSITPVPRTRRSPSPVKIMRDRPRRSRSRSPQRTTHRSGSPISTARRRHSRSPVPTSARHRSRSLSPVKARGISPPLTKTLEAKKSTIQPKKKLQAKVAPVLKKDPPKIIVGKRVRPKPKVQEPAYKLKPPEDPKSKAPLGLAPEVMKEAQERVTRAKKELAALQQKGNPTQANTVPNIHYPYGPNPPLGQAFYNTGFYGPTPPAYGPGMPLYGPPQPNPGFFGGRPMYRHPGIPMNNQPTHIMRSTIGPAKTSSAPGMVANPLHKQSPNNTTLNTSKTSDSTDQNKKEAGRGDVIAAKKTQEKIPEKSKETPVVTSKDKKKSEEAKKVESISKKKEVEKRTVEKESPKPEAVKKSSSENQTVTKSILKESKSATSEPKPEKDSQQKSAELLADDNFMSENDFMDPEEAKKLGCDPEYTSQAQKWMTCLRCAHDGHLISMCDKDKTKRALPFDIAKAKNRMMAKKKEILSKRNIQLPPNSTKAQTKSAAVEPKRSVSFKPCTKQPPGAKSKLKKLSTKTQVAETSIKKPKAKPSQVKEISSTLTNQRRQLTTKRLVGSKVELKRRSSRSKVQSSHRVRRHPISLRQLADEERSTHLSQATVVEGHRSPSPFRFSMATNDPLTEVEVKKLEIQSLELREMEIEQEMRLLHVMSAQNSMF